MIFFNIGSIVFYLLGFLYCIKHRNLFLQFAFVEIWLHTLFAICSFGWGAYFQNWIFALLAAVFLPTFNPENFKQSYKQTYFLSAVLFISYFGFAYLIHTHTFSFTMELSTNMRTIIFVLNNFIAFISIIMFAVTYTKNKESKEIELVKKANFDELTGIYNRHGIDIIEEALLKRSKKYSIAILDLDFFKPVNDTYGHKSGDIVLSKIGQILASYTSKNISVGRWGGEEFIIVGNSDIKYSDFVNTLEDIRKTVEKTKYQINKKKKINITVSIGSKYIKDGKSIEEGVSRADINLYKAKQTGRNKVIS
ncbi:MAG: GGDEF domain-containing protein [Bacilli bacterium]|nr:GGDEF domain-containing protein [Bacilli bacterium]